MRCEDIHTLIRCHTRPSMYFYSNSKESVISFICGYEIGCAGACNFTDLLSKHLADHHHIKPDSGCWPGQVSRLAQQRDLGWLDVYYLVSSVVLENAYTSLNDAAERLSTTD